MDRDTLVRLLNEHPADAEVVVELGANRESVLAVRLERQDGQIVLISGDGEDWEGS